MNVRIRRKFRNSWGGSNCKSDERPKCLLSLLFLSEIREKTVEYGQNQAEGQRPPKPVYLKICHEIVDQQDDDRIDHEEKKAKCKNGYRNGKKYEDGPDDDIRERDQDRNKQGSPIIRYMNTGKKVGGEHDGNPRKKKTQ